MKILIHFFPTKIKCNVEGCVNWYKGNCWLQGKLVKDYLPLMEFFSSGEKCQVRHFINKQKVTQMLEA